MQALKREVDKLHKNNIKLIMIGDRGRFDAALVDQINAAEQLTANNTALVLTIAANYGGRWDVLQAVSYTHLDVYKRQVICCKLFSRIYLIY